MPEWPSVAQLAAERWGTPLYALQESEIESAVQELESIESPLPVRHWLSCKTLAVPPLLSAWRKRNRGIEVVSAFELHAALSTGFEASRILVNGTAKHRWLRTFDVHGLRVQCDSVHELRELVQVASTHDWRVGLRIHTSENYDPDTEDFADQFGLAACDVPVALDILAEHNLVPECMSFHLRSHLRSTAPYLRAVEEVASICRSNSIRPQFLDIGGGLPVPGESMSGRDDDSFHLPSMSHVFLRAHELLSSVAELWLENGRFVSARAGALVIEVCDIKHFGDMRYLICDGGRVNHAFPSDWQDHQIVPVPERGGHYVPTTVCGPTCMAYDILCRRNLPSEIRRGDLLLWMNAGAYHIPWESRFSFGTAPIVWFSDEMAPLLVRTRERPEDWWPSE